MKSATLRYLQKVCERTETGSDYAAAKALGLSRNTVSNWRCGRSSMDDDKALIVAEFLGIDPFQIIAEIHAERSKDPRVKSLWFKLAKSHAQAASILLASALACFVQVPVSSAHSGGAPAAHDILCKRRRRHWFVLKVPPDHRRTLNAPTAYVSH